MYFIALTETKKGIVEQIVGMKCEAVVFRSHFHMLIAQEGKFICLWSHISLTHLMMVFWGLLPPAILRRNVNSFLCTQISHCFMKHKHVADLHSLTYPCALNSEIF